MFFDELSNDEWALLAALVSDEPAVRLNRRGRPRAEPRIVANAVLWILTTGEPWSKLPGRYPSGPTCRRRFEEWQLNGTLLEMVRLLSQTGRTFAYVPQPAPPVAAKPAAPVTESPRARRDSAWCVLEKSRVVASARRVEQPEQLAVGRSDCRHHASVVGRGERGGKRAAGVPRACGARTVCRAAGPRSRGRSGRGECRHAWFEFRRRISAQHAGARRPAQPAVAEPRATRQGNRRPRLCDLCRGGAGAERHVSRVGGDHEGRQTRRAFRPCRPALCGYGCGGAIRARLGAAVDRS